MNLRQENNSLNNVHYRSIFVHKVMKEITNNDQFIDHQEDIRLNDKLYIYYLLTYNDIINFVIDYNIRNDKRITFYLLTQEVLDLYLNDMIPYIIATRSEVNDINNNNTKIPEANVIRNMDSLADEYIGEDDLYQVLLDKYHSKIVSPVIEEPQDPEETPETP